MKNTLLSRPGSPRLHKRFSAWLAAIFEPKRLWLTAERVLALGAIIIASIPMALTALVVRCFLGKPLIFEQLRAGLGKKPFRIQKFRTMHDHRDDAGNLLPDLDRETVVTRFLRRSRLDELPQLFAIVRGDMSFIGPRPLLPETIESLGDLGCIRCSVRPGLTGWAQVSGNTRLSEAQRLSLDIWYIENRNLTLDLLILVKTIVTLIRGERVDSTEIAKAEAFLAKRERAAPSTFSR